MNLPIVNCKKETDITNKNKDTPAKKLSVIARKSPRLNPTEIPVEMPDDLLQGKKIATLNIKAQKNI